MGQSVKMRFSQETPYFSLSDTILHPTPPPPRVVTKRSKYCFIRLSWTPFLGPFGLKPPGDLSLLMYEVHRVINIHAKEVYDYVDISSVLYEKDRLDICR